MNQTGNQNSKPCLKRSLSSQKDFADFTNMLENALQAEVQRRQGLPKTYSIATNMTTLADSNQ